MTRPKDWTAGSVAVAVAAACVAVGAGWALWAVSPAVATLTATHAGVAGLCVLAATRNLRARLEATQQVVDAWNSSEARDELAKSPPAGTPTVAYDQDADREWVDITDGVASVEIAPGRPYDHTGDPVWTNVGAGPEDIQFSGLPELIGYPLPEATRATVQKYLPNGRAIGDREWARGVRHVGAGPGDVGHFEVPPGVSGWLGHAGPRLNPVEMTVAETDRLIANLQALPDDEHPVDLDTTEIDHSMWHLGQPCNVCGQPATTWTSDRPDPDEQDVTFLCDDHYAATMAEDGDRD